MEFNEAGYTERAWWAGLAVDALQWVRFLSSAGALGLALAGGHWQFSALLLLTWIPIRAFRGYVIACYAIDAGVFVIGVALGLPTLAFFGGLVPLAGLLVMALAFSDRYGWGNTSFFRIEQDDQLRWRAVRERKLSQWRERIARAPTDREALEPVVFEMRDWWMTPTQAARVACGAGASPELVNEIVFTVVRWPGLEEAERADAGWRWERAI